MPIQAAANRLKAEITNGKTRSQQPKEAPAAVVEEEKKEDKNAKKGKAKPVEVKA